jgi:hypothetical protein
MKGSGLAVQGVNCSDSLVVEKNTAKCVIVELLR